MIKRLVMISKEYPTDADPIYSFVDQLAQGIADAGVEVYVVAPLSLTRALLHGKALPPKSLIKTTANGARLTILRPRTLSFSDGKQLGIDCAMLTYKLFKRAVKSTLMKLPKPDALYGHFVALSGMCAAELGAVMQIPSFVGYGESSPVQYDQYDKRTLQHALKDLSGVVAVSSENARELKAQGIVGESARYGVFPNAVNTSRFHPIDRRQARAQLGYDQQDFIVSFVGALIERKGVMVLSDALNVVGDAKSIFVGKGSLLPDCGGILHLGVLPNDQVPLALGASDVFVLPTLAEGCCNAIVEALSMGLPVISSDLPFNDDILNPENSIRIDSKNADQIANAIIQLRDDKALREKLAAGALKKGMELEMPRRVKGILSFMDGKH